MGRSKGFFSQFFILPIISLLIQCNILVTVAKNGYAPVHVGVILDLETMAGKRSQTSILMGFEDFYAAHANFSTRVVLNFRDTMQDALGATSAAIDMLTDDGVQVIIGPQTSEGTQNVVSMCNWAHVPVLTFSSYHPTLSSLSPYFLSATLDDSLSALPIASFIQLHGWHSIVLVYEDSDYGIRILPSFSNALQQVNVAISEYVIIPNTATDEFIEMELNKLQTKSTRVFIVHMMPLLASRFFVEVSKFGMMDEGYVWIVTSSISSMVETLDHNSLDAMQGLSGVRSFVPGSFAKSKFISRFKTKFRQDHPQNEISTPTLHELLAYDTAWLVALAVEKVELARRLAVRKTKFHDNNLTCFNKIIVRENGRIYLDAIRSIKLDGLSGNFQFVKGQSQASTYEIINVIGKGVRVVGFWTPESEIGGTLNSSGNGGLKNMKTIVWPGDNVVAPRGFTTRLSEKTLRVGIPRSPNKQLVNVTYKMKPTGYCIDVFDAVMKKLSHTLAYDYIPVPNYNTTEPYTYGELIHMVARKDFDVAVGDMTILANRSQIVDFSFSFVEPGISMLVRVRDDTNAWIFLKPLTADLWIASLFFFFFTGFVIWIIEQRINPELRGTRFQQLGISFYLAFSTQEKLESNLSRFAMIVWLFVVLVLTSSYTASFTSILTVQQLEATTNVNDLIRRGEYVGYQSNYTRDFLIKLGFDSGKLVELYGDSSAYSSALNKGSGYRYGGVAAIFDEIPYIKLFLSDHCTDHYAMVGPTYESNGFGFVFPKGSPLVSDINSAILSLKDTGEMDTIRDKWFQNLSASCQLQNVSSDYLRLSFENFAGLFTITGVITGLMLVISLAIFIFNEWDKLKEIASSESTTSKTLLAWLKFYNQKDYNSPAFKKYNEPLQGGEGVRRKCRAANMDNTTELELVRPVSSRSSPPQDEHSGSFFARGDQSVSILLESSEATNQ